MKTISMLLLVAVLVPFSTAAAQTSSTVVISPIIGNPQASANQIVAALAAILDNGPARPYLIKIEPGVYDFGPQSLFMKPWVDIEGSGHDITTFLAQGKPDFAIGTVVTASNAELRQLTVKTLGAGHEAAVGIVVQTPNSRITDVAIESTGANLGCDGVLVRFVETTLTRVSIFASGSTTTTGVAVESGASAVLDNVEVEVRNATSINRSILVLNNQNHNSLDVRNSRLESHGGNNSFGIHMLFNIEFTATLDNVDIVANQASGTNAGIQSSDDERLQIADSRILASGGSQSYGFSDIGGFGRLKIDNSFIAGTTASISRLLGSSQAQIGGSKLFGGAVVGNVVCAGVWDKNYVFFTNTCP